MAQPQRYRRHNGRTCIDLRVRTTRQLFDGRDPAPFRERDLDEHARDYILEAAAEIPTREPLTLSVHIAEGPDPDLDAAVIRQAVTTHFAYELDRAEHRLHRHLQQGYVSAAVGLVTLGALLSLAELLPVSTSTALGVVREGLIIMGWVALWRPLELLLYDWWPLVQQRRHIDRLAQAYVDVQYGPSEGT